MDTHICRQFVGMRGKKEIKEGQVSVWERNREREWECEGMEEKEREGIMKSGERERLFIFIVH